MYVLLSNYRTSVIVLLLWVQWVYRVIAGAMKFDGWKQAAERPARDFSTGTIYIVIARYIRFTHSHYQTVWYFPALNLSKYSAWIPWIPLRRRWRNLRQRHEYPAIPLQAPYSTSNLDSISHNVHGCWRRRLRKRTPQTGAPAEGMVVVSSRNCFCWRSRVCLCIRSLFARQRGS